MMKLCLTFLLNEKSSLLWWWMWGTLLSGAPSEGWGSNDQKLLPILRLSWAPFISIPDCEAKSCAHQSQVCKVTVNGVRKWQPRYKQGPVQDFSGNACLFDSRMSQLHITLRCCCILFCRKIYKSQLPESSEFFEAENLHISLPQSNCAGDYSRANFNLFSCCWFFSVHYELSDRDWSQEQLSCRRLEEILSRVYY